MLTPDLLLAGKGSPRADEAERYVLGCVLQDFNSLMTATRKLKLRATDFYLERHQVIYGTAVELEHEGSPADVIAVIGRLRDKGKLEFSGGQEYLLELVESVGAYASLPHHTEVIQEKSLLRSVILGANEVIARAQQPGAEARQVLQTAQQDFTELARERVDQGLRSVGDLLEETLGLIEQYRVGEISGTPTGFHDLDKLTTGLHEGELIVLAARPGMGKTAFALSLAAHPAIDQNLPVAFFSLEMDASQLMLRILCQRGKIPMQELRQGRLAAEFSERIPLVADQLQQAPFYIDDQPNLTLPDLRTKCMMLREALEKEGKAPLSLVVVDYLQLMSGGENAESRQVFISQVSRGLKQLSKELKVPVIALSQLSRKIEDRPSASATPKLSDLRESGAIEQDADMVWFINRKSYGGGTKNSDDNAVETDPTEAELIVAKHRNGPTADVKLTFLAEHAGFYNPIFHSSGHGGYR